MRSWYHFWLNLTPCHSLSQGSRSSGSASLTELRKSASTRQSATAMFTIAVTPCSRSASRLRALSTSPSHNLKSEGSSLLPMSRVASHLPTSSNLVTLRSRRAIPLVSIRERRSSHISRFKVLGVLLAFTLGVSASITEERLLTPGRSIPPFGEAACWAIGVGELILFLSSLLQVSRALWIFCVASGSKLRKVAVSSACVDVWTAI
mmetsp:Transcript_35660/g.63444  ORF Transcript_35660/g.63444 Transcript_35660/m.63444 type:complete len:206 (-) Transcript_35660:89-706(-)